MSNPNGNGTTQIHRAQNRINYWNNEDHRVLLYGAVGISYRAIADKLGLSTGQVGYRLKRIGVRVRDYRNGTSPVAQRMMASAAKFSTTFVNKAIDDFDKHRLQLEDGRKKGKIIDV